MTGEYKPPLDPSAQELIKLSKAVPYLGDDRNRESNKHVEYQGYYRSHLNNDFSVSPYKQDRLVANFYNPNSPFFVDGCYVNRQRKIQ